MPWFVIGTLGEGVDIAYVFPWNGISAIPSLGCPVLLLHFLFCTWRRLAQSQASACAKVEGACASPSLILEASTKPYAGGVHTLIPLKIPTSKRCKCLTMDYQEIRSSWNLLDPTVLTKLEQVLRVLQMSYGL